MKATKILLAAAVLALPMLGACDDPVGPEQDVFRPQMGLGTSPGPIAPRTKIKPTEGGITSVRPVHEAVINEKGVIIQ